MRRAMLVALGTGAVISSAAALAISAAGSDAQQSLSRDEYEAALHALEAARGPALDRCEALVRHEREFCRAEVEAEQLVHAADAEAAYRRSERTARAALQARFDARYQLDRARCAPLGGVRRDQCLIEAHAAKGRAMLAAAGPYQARY